MGWGKCSLLGLRIRSAYPAFMIATFAVRFKEE